MPYYLRINDCVIDYTRPFYTEDKLFDWLADHPEDMDREVVKSEEGGV